jgi:hypothetical protein
MDDLIDNDLIEDSDDGEDCFVIFESEERRKGMGRFIPTRQPLELISYSMNERFRVSMNC